MSYAVYSPAKNSLSTAGWYHPRMRNDPDSDQILASPFDPYITEALAEIVDRGDTPLAALGDMLVRRLEWLPGFADVIVGILRTNRLIVVNEWEPGKIHVTKRGQMWLAAHAETISVR
jgi:hypothetical protein